MSIVSDKDTSKYFRGWRSKKADTSCQFAQFMTHRLLISAVVQTFGDTGVRRGQGPGPDHTNSGHNIQQKQKKSYIRRRMGRCRPYVCLCQSHTVSRTACPPGHTSCCCLGSKWSPTSTHQHTHTARTAEQRGLRVAGADTVESLRGALNNTSPKHLVPHLDPDPVQGFPRRRVTGGTWAKVAWL